MQILKEELKALILEKSEKEFLQKGYENASLRNIAKQSGTTIGNLYHYFTSKETLFDELVKNEYDTFLYLMEHHSEIDIPDELTYKKDIYVWRSLFRKYIDQLMPVFTKRFLLLFDKNSGTKYENAKSKFINLMEENICEHLKASRVSMTLGFSLVLSEQLLNSLLIIVKNSNDDETKKQLICDTLLFYIAGVVRLSES